MASIANGDLRKSILILQNVKYIKVDSENKHITKNDIYEMCKYISDEQINEYIMCLNNNKNMENIINITNQVFNNGYIIYFVIEKIINYLMLNTNISDKDKSKIIFEMSTIEKNINDGADEYIQLLKIFISLSILNL